MRLDRISYSHIIETIQQRLADLMADGIISESEYERKKNAAGIIDWVNRADIEWNRYKKEEHFLGLYIPAGVAQIRLSYQDKYDGLDELKRLQTDANILKDIFVDEYWLSDDRYYDVDQIISSVIAYKSVHNLRTQAQTSYKVVASDQFSDPSILGAKAYMEASSKNLYLSDAVSEAGFLFVKAILVPGRIDVATVDLSALSTLYLRATMDMEDLIVLSTLQKMLSFKIRREAGIVEDLGLAIDMWKSGRSGSGPVVYLPQEDRWFDGN